LACDDLYALFSEKKESAGGFPCGLLFSDLFSPSLVFREGEIKRGWVSNYDSSFALLFPD